MNLFRLKFGPAALGLCLLLLWGPLLGQATGGRQPIPGIDKIPRAIDPGGGGGSGDPGDPNAPEEEALSTEQPLIQQLKVVKHPKLPHSALITWKVDPRNQTAIYIGRYSRPVSTRDLVFEAENLTAPPLGPREVQFVDRNIPDGTYYYVAVTSGEVGEGGNLLMRPNQNYTSQPFVVFRKEKEQVRRKQYYVINLTAVNNNDSVSLSWSPSLARNVEHTVYRSRVPLDNPAAFNGAVKLGTTPETTYDFKDSNPLRNEKVFYGVTVTTRADNREYKQLSEGESFVAHAFRPRQVSSNMDKFLPSGLVAYLEGADNVKLLWTGPIARVRELKVYRSGVPISNLSRLRRAKFLGKVQGGRNEYFDRGLRPGRYFYALIPVKADGSEMREFWEARTYTADAIVIRGNTGPGITRLTAKASDVRDISIRWDVRREDKDEVRYFLYRSDRPMQNAPDVREHGQLLRTFDDTVTSFIDRDLDPGRYFYALLLEIEGVVSERMIAGSNYLRRPVILGGRRQQQTRRRNTAYELEYVLNMTYRRGLFEEAIRRLAPFVHNRHNPGEIVSRAMLYTGLAYYNLRLYRSALPIFMHAQVRRYYPERSRFWYNRTMEKMR